jgi:hypothetical protein
MVCRILHHSFQTPSQLVGPNSSIGLGGTTPPHTPFSFGGTHVPQTTPTMGGFPSFNPWSNHVTSGWSNQPGGQAICSWFILYTHLLNVDSEPTHLA